MNRILIVSLSLLLAACNTTADQPTPASTPSSGVVDGKADSFSGDDVVQPIDEDPQLDAKLDSREFKVMLEPSLFDGESVEEMLGFLQDEIDTRFPMEAEDLELTNLRKERTVEYLDVRGSCDLRRSGFTLRQRQEDDEQEATLKYRSPERYLASAISVDSSHPDAESKFEEDIKPGYASVYSRSTGIPVELDSKIDDIDEARTMWESLSAAPISDEARLEPVGGLRIYERQYGRIKYDLGEFKAKMSVTLWSLEPDGDPLVAELSFKYEEDEDDFDVPSVRNGMNLFRVLEGLHEWRSVDSPTKTAFVYEHAEGFCD